MLALLVLALWQWISNDERPIRQRHADTSSIERNSPVKPTATAPPTYDVEGIDGIVAIDTPEPAQNTPSGAVIEAVAKLPELAAQAKAGNHRAMTSLALTQRAGLGGRADPLQAIALLERAAAAGNVHALTALAEEYESGIWITQDIRKARALREQAASAGSQLAQWELEP